MNASNLKSRPASTYQSIPSFFVSIVDQTLERIIRRENAFPNTYSIIIIILLNCLIYFGIILLLIQPAQASAVERSILIGTSIFVPVIISVSVFTERMHRQLIQHTLPQALECLPEMSDRQDLKQWVGQVFSLKTQTIAPLLSGLFAGLLLAYGVSLLLNTNLTIGGVVAIIVYAIQSASYICTYYMILALPHRFAIYNVKLFAVSPGDSEIIEQLSNLLSRNVIAIGILASFFTLWFWIFQIFQPIWTVLLLLAQWLVIISAFSIGQSALAALIKQAKRRKLNDIQARIELIEREGDISRKEDLESIQRLVEYHERVKKTRASALDFNAVLQFLQTLLLPLIASIIANINEIIKLLSL